MKLPNSAVLAFVALLLLSGLAWFVASLGGDAGAANGAPEAPAAGRDAAGRGPDADATPSPGQRTRADDPTALLTISGRVLDAYGEPLARALVGDADDEQPTYSDPQGRFELHTGRDRASITLLVLAAGHAPLLSVQDLGAGATMVDAGDLQLLRGGGIHGSVTDAAGSPLAGASVSLRLTSSSVLPAAADLEGILRPVTTDTGGGFAYSDLAPGSYRIAAVAPGKQAVQSGAIVVREGGDTTADPLALADGHQLKGRVLGPGDQALGGATVRLRNGNGQPRYEGEVRTGGDGRFALDALPRGPLRLEVERQGFLRHRQSDVDPASGQELVVRLEAGLAIHGTVVDARTGAPVEQFAVTVRSLGSADPAANPSTAQQLRQRIDSLRAVATRAADPEQRAQQTALAAEFETRLEHLARTSRPVAVPADTGAVAAHPAGRFAVEGLEEGLHAVGIASPEHRFALAEPVELRRAAPAPELRFELAAGHLVAGTVVSIHDGAPVAGAAVELVCVAEAEPGVAGQRSLYPWVFAPGGPRGVTVMTARTSGGGRFEFHNAAPGRYQLAVRHAHTADHETEVFALQDDRRDLRVAVGARASLTGRVADATAGRPVEVLVLGGHGTLRTVKAGSDGGYRFDDLQPGSYLVRAFPADASQYVNRLFGSIFPLHAGAVVPEHVPPCDLTLAAGERRTFDLALDLPATGSVQGTVAVNGRGGRGGRALLRPLPGAAPGAGGLSLRGDYDEFGRFAIADVPAGKYTLALSGASRQELYSEPIEVTAGTTATVQVDLPAGGLRGRVAASDATAPDELRGYLWVLPGATEAPADLYEYRRTNRTHRIAVRNGAFEDAELTPGPAVVVADLRGRALVAAKTVVVPARTVDLELAVPTRKP